VVTRSSKGAQSGELILRKKGIFARKFWECQLLGIVRPKKKG